MEYAAIPHSRICLIGICLTVIGCDLGLVPYGGGPNGGGGGGGGDDTAASDDGAVQITEVDPDSGPLEGGTTVYVRGEGFYGDITVYFDDTLISATRLTSNEILLVTPSSSTAKAVDVRVKSDRGETTAPWGFTYSDGGGGEDTGDTEDNSGLTGGFAEVGILQIACPDCFGLSSNIDVYADAAFHTPVSGSWFDWMPASGSCEVEPTATSPASSLLSVGDWVYLSSGSTSVGMRSTTTTGGVYYEASGLGVSDFKFSSGYDLSVPDGGSIGSFDINDAVVTPQGFTTVTPAELLYSSPSSAFAAMISRSGETFGWVPSGGSGTFMITVAAYSASTGQYIGSAVCRGPDNGSLRFPGSVLASFPAGSLLAVYMTRYSLETTEISANGSSLEAVATSGVLGTGVLTY